MESKEIQQHQFYTMRPKIWKKLQAENVLSDKYKNRQRSITRYVWLSAPLQFIQRILFAKKVDNIKLSEDPVFILGHWRSGTTHLHYTMAKDERLGFLNNYQAYVFNLALLSKSRVRRMTRRFFPDTRPQDNVKISPDDPAEEEQPLSCFSTRTGIHTFFFPQNGSYFEKYNLFKNISDVEKQAWQTDYQTVVKGIAYYNQNKPLLLKNPHNTGRVKELLELYPKAKFVFIHRNPYDVYRSTMHLFNSLVHTQYLQEINQDELHHTVIKNFKSTLDKYLDERHLIPKGQLVEISFDELESDGFETIKRIYQALEMKLSDSSRAAIKSYLSDIQGYKKNKFHGLDANLKAEITQAWQRYIKEFGYS